VHKVGGGKPVYYREEGGANRARAEVNRCIYITRTYVKTHFLARAGIPELPESPTIKY